MSRPLVGITLDDDGRQKRVDRRGDDLELAPTREAVRIDLPTLAICRGHRVSNVATGGTLHQHIASTIAGGQRHEHAEARAWRVHAVDVRDRARLSSLLGEGLVFVNSVRHQSVRVGENAEACQRGARAESR